MFWLLALPIAAIESLCHGGASLIVEARLKRPAAGPHKLLRMLLRVALLLIASVLTAADFSGERALEAVKTAVAFGPRPSGSAASRRMQAWISRELKAQGWEVVETVSRRGRLRAPWP